MICLQCFNLTKQKRNKFCSRKCFHAFRIATGYNIRPRIRVKVKCYTCKKSLEIVPCLIKKFKRHFCNNNCKAIWQRTRVGVKAARWKHGKARRGYIWLTNRKKRLEKDKYICQICFKIGNAVHHRKPPRFYKNHNLSHRLSNLITLCSSCHRALENKIRMLKS